jgi:hypothetical protein
MKIEGNSNGVKFFRIIVFKQKHLVIEKIDRYRSLSHCFHIHKT